MMKRATLLLDDTLYERAKNLSKKRGTTLKEVLNDLLRRALANVTPKGSGEIKIPLHHHIGPQAGIDISDRSSLLDLIENSTFAAKK